MPYTTVAKHRMLDHLVGNTASGSAITQASAHNSFPPTSGNEISGGTYARKAVTFTAAGAEADGRVDHAAITFDIPGGNTVSSIAYLDAAGVIMAYGNVTDEAFATDGQYQVTADSYMHLDLP